MAPGPQQERKTTDEKMESIPSDKPAVEKLMTVQENTIQVDTAIYDAQKLASIHPGGELFVKAFAGRDATEAFLSYHRREFPHTKMTDCYIGKAVARKEADADADLLELFKLVDDILPRHKSFAPFSYYVKVVVLLGAAFGLEYYIHSTGSYKWYLTGLLGWFFALIGLNIQHDANHGAISKYGIVNRLFGMTQNWIGGSALDWIHQHVVQHHIYPNDVHMDPDIAGNDIIRFNPLKVIQRVHMFQYLYVFMLLGFFGVTYILDSVGHIVRGFHYSHMSKLVRSNRVFELGTFAFFGCRWVLLPLLRFPSIYTFLNILPMFLVGGYYLAFFFVISHNFEGVYLLDQKVAEQGKLNTSFLHKQVVTGSNVGGAWLCFLNGGLNYQIEHHLFPRMQHSHYPKIAPVVRAFCEKKGIPYVHFPTVWDNLTSCSRHLRQMGTRQSPPGYHTKAM